MDIWLELGRNREHNLTDDAAALEAYEQIASASRHTGSATYFRGVQGAARMHRKAGRFDKALATLRVVDVKKLRGYWRGSMLLALGKTFSAAGREDDALATYRELLADDSVIPRHRRAAKQAIDALK